MPAPHNPDLVRQLLENAEKAAQDIRREAGGLSRLMAFLERWAARREQRWKEAQRQAALARCWNGMHDFQNWKFEREILVYPDGKKDTNALPVQIKRAWIGHCAHCGQPVSKTVTML